jgi:tetratricopeptide (TPR) repeat protein
MADDRAARLRLAEATLIKALSMAPQHALAHVYLGAVQTYTNRAAHGIAEYEQALALDRNLAIAHGWIGLAKYFMGRGAETEAHIQEALRLSPRDALAYRWMTFAGLAKAQVRAEDEAVAWLRRGIEANRNQPMLHFNLAAALARLGELDEARAAVQAGLALNPGFTINRFRSGTPSDNPTFLAQRERIYQGMRMAGVPEG